MSLNTGNIYSIPEHPAEENEENYCEVFLSAKEPNVSEMPKKTSTSSLPERPNECGKHGLNHKISSIPTLITPSVEDEPIEAVTGSKTFKKNVNRLSVSLIDFSDSGLAPDRGALKTDKGENVFTNMASSHQISQKYSKSYLEVQDCISHSNDEPVYEILLSPNGIHNVNSNLGSNSTKFTQKKARKDSEGLFIIDLNDEEEKDHQKTNDLDEPSLQRPRSRSMQWIQNTFQNVSNKYKYLLEFRRPSDIVEERMRKSQEELEMEETESDAITDEKGSTPTLGGRRYSENVIGKQKQRFPFVPRLGNLKDLWRDRNVVSKRQEESDIDQTRADVCPLFTFPKKRDGDEDEQILDALRQAMRKCTVVDPTSRPTSTVVLDQLSKLLDES